MHEVDHAPCDRTGGDPRSHVQAVTPSERDPAEERGEQSYPDEAELGQRLQRE